MLQHIIRQDIRRGYDGLAVIDLVGGELVPSTVAWLGELHKELTIRARTPYPVINEKIRRTRDRIASRVIVLDFTREDCPFFFNPLEQTNGLTAADCSGDVLGCFARATQGNLDEQLRRQLNLRACFSLTSELGGTLYDSAMLLLKNDDEIHGYLDYLWKRAEASGRRPKLEFVKDYLTQFFCATSGKERRDLVASSWTAMNVFLSDERVRRFVSVPKGNLDFDAIVNGGRYLLVRLPQGDLNTQSVLGSMIVNRIKTTCRSRSLEQRKRDFSLIVDEFHLLFSPEWAEEIATVRNYGLNLILSHQNESQLLSDNGSRKFLEAVTSNTETQVFFRLGAEEAFRVAYSVFRPRGQRKKLEYTESTESEQTTQGKSVTRSIGLAIGKALGRSKGVSFSLGSGHTVSFSESDGISRAVVEGLGLSFSQGRNWSQCVSESDGVIVTQSGSETFVEGVGKGKVDSRSEGESSSTGESHGTANGHSEGEASFYSFSDGQSLSYGGLDAGFAGLHTANQENSGRGSSSNSGKSHSDVHTTQETQGRHLSRAIANVVSGSRSLAKSKGQSSGVSHSTTRSEGTGGSETETTSRSLAKSLGYVKNYCRSMGESISRTQARTQAETETDSKTVTRGVSVARQESTAKGRSKSFKKSFYSVDEEARVRSYEFMELPFRHAIVYSRETGKVSRIRTHDIAFGFDLFLGGVDYGTDFVRRALPKPVELPEKSVFERLEERELEAVKGLEQPEGF